MAEEKTNFEFHPGFKERSNTKEMLVDKVKDFLSIVDLKIKGVENKIMIGEFYHPDAVFETIIEIMPLPGSRLEHLSKSDYNVGIEIEFYLPNSIVVARKDPGKYDHFRIHQTYTEDPNKELDNYYADLAAPVFDLVRKMSKETSN